jgi:hypothetical protein
MVDLNRPRKNVPPCVVRLDRLVFTARGRTSSGSLGIESLEVVRDVRVRPQSVIATYARVRSFRNRTTGSKIAVQYKPQVPWLGPFRVTSVGQDRLGLTPEELNPVAAHFSGRELSLAEVAFDFPADSGVDLDFVMRHAKFGKSRRCADRGGPGQLRFGGRGSPKLVRCYWKPALDCFRVELELHAALLRRFSIADITDLPKVRRAVFPRHFRFVGFKWRRLESHLLRKFDSEGRSIYEEVRRRSEISLQSALRFLKGKEVANAHRFLRALRLNEDVERALDAWASRYSAWGITFNALGRQPTAKKRRARPRR